MKFISFHAILTCLYSKWFKVMLHTSTGNFVIRIFCVMQRKVLLCNCILRHAMKKCKLLCRNYKLIDCVIVRNEFMSLFSTRNILYFLYILMCWYFMRCIFTAPYEELTGFLLCRIYGNLQEDFIKHELIENSYWGMYVVSTFCQHSAHLLTGFFVVDV